MIGALRAFYWEIKMDISGAIRYHFGVITDIIVFSILLSVFLFTDSGESYRKIYNYSNYKEFIVLGYLAWVYASTAISSIAQIISGELKMGTFYKKYNSRYPLQLLLLGRFIASLIIETVVTIILLLFSKLVWKVDITFHPMIIFTIIISTLGMYGIGLIVAGLIIFYKRIGSITFLIQTGLLFITDTIPVSNGILSISKLLPLTSCNLIIKYLLIGRNYSKEFIQMSITTVAFLTIGIFIFSFFLKKARKKGNLLFY